MERMTPTEPVEMVEALLAETGNNPPIGIDPRSEAGAAQLYRRLRDARSSARRDERAVEAAGNAPAPQPVSRAWAEVSDLARQILRDEAKDIEVLAWLTEAETRLRGHAGLADSL
ncbi:MAG: type VI secretion system ImpA family N-terminal domain-containing protein, partial [Paracoccus sp. (in: a-proteobacteria)]|nr:type VI secretion system ImpA family N-terminal domain-containing protein [Paracoccus sp. (in: a-proteobacteria)]